MSTKGQWQPASNGAGPRHWFLSRDAKEVMDRYHWSKSGKLIRYASCASAKAAAEKLNES